MNTYRTGSKALPVIALAAALAAPLAATLSMAPLPALAQAYPSKPITLVVPFPPGGGTDAFARPLAAQLTKQFGQSMVIDNRGGAGGTIGASYAAKQPGDGYTWFMGAAHHAIAPAMYSKLDYDMERDFVPVGLVATPPQVIVANPQKIPADDLKGLLDWLRANPRKANFGSAGSGTSHHLAGELFKQLSKTEITHVPYKGTTQVHGDVVVGDLLAAVTSYSAAKSLIDGGRMNLLGVGSKERAPNIPNAPALSEAIPGHEITSFWFGIMAPPRTPAGIVNRLHEAVTAGMNEPDVVTPFDNVGLKPLTASVADFRALITREKARFTEAANLIGLKPQ